MPATFVLGLLLGWILIRTRNILLAITGHAMNNLLVLLVVTYWDKINSHALFLMDVKQKNQLSALVVLLSVILMYLATIWPRRKKLTKKT